MQANSTSGVLHLRSNVFEQWISANPAAKKIDTFCQELYDKIWIFIDQALITTIISTSKRAVEDSLICDWDCLDNQRMVREHI